MVSLAAVTKKYSHLLRSNETMTTQILFGPDLDYDEADVASFESSWTDDTTVDSQSVDDTENNDQDSRVATEFDFSFILNATNDEAETEADAEEDDIASISIFSLSWISTDNVNDIEGTVKDFLPLAGQIQDENEDS